METRSPPYNVIQMYLFMKYLSYNYFFASSFSTLFGDFPSQYYGIFDIAGGMMLNPYIYSIHTFLK